MIRKLSALGALLAFHSTLGLHSVSHAIPNEPHERGVISGAVKLIGCSATPNQVAIKVMPVNRVIRPQSVTRAHDGTSTFPFRAMIGTLGETGALKLRLIVPSTCQGASVAPSEVAIGHLPGVAAFKVTMPMQGQRVDIRNAVNLVDIVLNTLELRLHNYQQNGSFVKIAGQQFPFAVPPTNIKLRFHLGSLTYFLNDIRLLDAGLVLNGSTMKLGMSFEGNGVELKGRHSRLGDTGAPDFQIQNLNLSATPRFHVRTDGKLDLAFDEVKMTGAVDSTGGCNPFGFDLCDAIFGTDGKVKNGIQTAAASALNSALVRGKIAEKMSEFLATQGVTGSIVYYKMDGAYLEVFTR